MPISEAKRCIETETDSHEIVSSGPGYIIASFDEKYLNSISDRISLTHRIGKYIGDYNLGDISNLKNIILPEGTFAIRIRRFEGMRKDIDSQKIVHDVGSIISKYNDVDLRDPDIIIRVQICDRIHIYIEQAIINTSILEERKVDRRPFFSPISIHPKFARALINLTGVKRGETILDPFCGTGGIAIEAAKMGMNVVVSDFDEDMVIGCQENMDFYGLNLKDFDTVDVGEIKNRFDNINAVCTDPPYGRSTKTGGECIKDIYKRAENAISEVLTDNGRAGIILPYKIIPRYMTLDNIYIQRVHRSLYRCYHIMHK